MSKMASLSSRLFSSVSWLSPNPSLLNGHCSLELVLESMLHFC